MEVFKNTKLNTLKTKVNNLGKNIPDVTTLIHINQYNTHEQNLGKKLEMLIKKIPDTSGLVTTTVLNSEVENKIPHHAKYITTQEFNNLIVENFAARLKQPNLVTKTGFDNKLISFNRKIISNKTKYLEVKKKLNGLTTKDYNFFIGRIYFKSNDGS